jgi:hypothetical protein
VWQYQRKKEQWEGKRMSSFIKTALLTWLGPSINLKEPFFLTTPSKRWNEPAFLLYNLHVTLSKKKKNEAPLS